MFTKVRLLTVATLVAGASVAAAYPAQADISHARSHVESARKFASESGDQLRDDAAQWYFDQRSAPADAIAPGAFAAIAPEASKLPDTDGRWRELTRGRYFSDSQAYHDKRFPYNAPATTDSNSGAGDRWVSGRVTALAAAKDHTLFAGVSSGGVWRSRDGGQHWQPIFDNGPTMSIGAIAVDNTSGDPFTVYVGTGEANFADSYAGVGVLASTDGGNHFTELGGASLDGALIYRLVVDPVDNRRLYAATSHGLYRIEVGRQSRWQRILSFDGKYRGAYQTPINERVWNNISDVVVLPGTGGATGHVLAVAGWLGGTPTNGLYLSTNGGDSFKSIGGFGNLTGTKLGRVTLAASRHGGRLYALAQDTNFKYPNGSILGGVFTSTNGPTGPWHRIATSPKLARSGSALAPSLVKIAYQPGVQATYNQFLTVDPHDSRHVYLGLEEVFETRDAGAHWKAIAPYWNFSLPTHCFSYHPFEGSCNHHQAHADQHAAVIANGQVYIGNDGGVYGRPVSDDSVGHWHDYNRQLRTLLFYSATSGARSGGPLVVYGGMQDNGSGKFFGAPTVVPNDYGKPLRVYGVQPFGGDGGYTVVDPHDPRNVITEYTFMAIRLSNNGGHTWKKIAPPDPGAQFIAPVMLDPLKPNHLVAGGAFLWDTTAGFHTTTSDWKKVYDFTNGRKLPRVATALATKTVGGISTTWAAWCGPCSGSAFQSGIVVLNNSGGRWHPTRQYTSASGQLPPRYITGISIAPGRAFHAYVSLSGFSNTWQIGPRDPGVGHVFSLSGGTVRNLSGDLIDAPADSIMATRDGGLVVGTDFGAWVSQEQDGDWARLGTNLPNVPVLQLSTTPDGQILAATHGRGCWTIPEP